MTTIRSGVNNPDRAAVGSLLCRLECEDSRPRLAWFRPEDDLVADGDIVGSHALQLPGERDCLVQFDEDDGGWRPAVASCGASSCASDRVTPNSPLFEAA